MKKTLTLFALVPLAAAAQSLVGTTPENRTALLEDFTGIHCGYCPEGHVIMAALEDQYKDRFVTVGVHAGGYAVPSGGEPDFRTDEGTELDAHFTIGGYPAGVVNRHLWDGADDIGRGAWEGAVQDILAMPSPVNLGVESSYDAGTQTLTVHVYALYTDNSAAGNDYISVFVKEDHLFGYQADYTNGTHLNYDHKHVLRAYMTDVWGDDVGDHVTGDVVERTYSIQVPPEWTIANCEVGAFISEYQSEVYQAREVAADGGTTLIVGTIQGDPNPYRPGTQSVATGFSNTFVNAMGSTQDFIVSLVDVYAPFSWNADFSIDGNTYWDATTVNVADAGSIAVNVDITPNGNPGISTYELRIASASAPGAPLITQQFHVISGVHDLVVSNPQAETHDEIYWQGLGNEFARAKTTKAEYLAFASSNSLNEVNNLYVNISWTFPCLTDELVNALSDFMDNGGNVMIAGQDIGWDNSGATGSYGTPVTQAFYADYMLATFVADGAATDNAVDFEDADAVFGGVSNSGIADVFGGNTYPDEITPIAPAAPILRYNTPTKIGGLRAQSGSHKIVYMGVGPEQMADANVGHMMVQLSHDWFYGIVSVDEFDAAMNNLGQAYPSPANESVNIPVSAAQNGTLDVFDATGRLVMSENISATRAIVTLNTSALNAGMYSARVRGTNASATSFSVVH